MRESWLPAGVLAAAELETNWRNSADYAALLDADRSILAWEWLRRNAHYQASARKAAAGASQLPAETWGLHAYEAAKRRAPEARPIWLVEVYPAVLSVEAEAVGPGEREAFDASSFGRLATIHRGQPGGEHLLLSDGLRTIRIDVLTGSLAGGARGLRYRLGGLRAAETQLLTLRRFLAFWRTGRFAAALHPREVRAPRWIATLRAYDALAAGADQREIAEVLLSRDAAEPRWRTESASLRSRVQRLVRESRRMAAGGYLRLLSS